VVVDDGARRALIERGTSLLPIGVTGVEGTFRAGQVVDIADRSGTVIARGWVSFSSDDLRRIQGRRTSEIASILGLRDFDEAIHRDNLVLLERRETVHENDR
jgi:glutamate 5-kinase